MKGYTVEKETTPEQPSTSRRSILKKVGVPFIVPTIISFNVSVLKAQASVQPPSTPDW